MVLRMGFSSSYIGVPMLYGVFAFWAGATIAIMGRQVSFNLESK